MRCGKLFVPALLAMAVAAPAGAQTFDLQAVISGEGGPKALKDLNGSWRRVQLQGPQEKTEGGGGLMGLMAGMFGGMFGGDMSSMMGASAKPPAYTQGRTVAVGSEVFLVVYRPRTKPLDPSILMKKEPPMNLPPPEKLSLETPLTLSLVNLRAINSLGDIRPFNLEEELAEGAKAAEQEAAFREELLKKGNPFGGGGAVFDAAPAPVIEPPVVTAPEEVAPPPPAPKPAKKPAPATKPAPKPRR